MENTAKPAGFIRNTPTLAIIVAVLLVFGAKLNFRMGVVPITLQSLVLFMACLVFPRVPVLMGTALYLAAGWFFPVFSDSSFGTEFYSGRRTGYVIAFLPAAFMVSAGKKHFHDWFGYASLVVLGHALILLFGWLWLVIVSKFNAGQAFLTGVVPLMPGALLKSILVAALFVIFERRSKEKQFEA